MSWSFSARLSTRSRVDCTLGLIVIKKLGLIVIKKLGLKVRKKTT